MKTPIHAPADQAFRSGFVAFLGQPNVGKSTLLNAILGAKVAIVSPKPQTTRDRIAGIYTDDFCQIVFVDTPGVMEPRDAFNECLRDGALEALQDAEAACHLVDGPCPSPLPAEAAEALKRSGKPCFLVVNKCDRLPALVKLLPDEPPSPTDGFVMSLCALPAGEDPVLSLAKWKSVVPNDFDAAPYQGVLFISALERRGLSPLVSALRRTLPQGPLLYDPEQLTDRDLRFLAAEIVREKVLECMEQEVPYSVATRTEEYKERPESKHYVRIVINVEHESQKGIVIGKGGEMLHRIGAKARPEIEELAGHPVFLDLWVKVRKNWRKRENELREFGYRTQTRPSGRRRRRS